MKILRKLNERVFWILTETITFLTGLGLAITYTRTGNVVLGAVGDVVIAAATIIPVAAAVCLAVGWKDN